MDETKRTEYLQQLADLLKNFSVAMLTTIQPRDGSLHSRPMMAQGGPLEGSLWFFSRFNSAKVDEIRGGSQVNLAYSSPETGRYVSVSGAAYIIRERMHMETLWSEIYRDWFPSGLDDPDLALLRIDITEAEFWDEAREINQQSLKFS